MNTLRVAARTQTRALRQQRLASTISVVSHTSSESALPLSNVEVQWAKLAKDEQVQIYRQLEAVQKKDWKSLTIDEKKAGKSSFGVTVFFFSVQRLVASLWRWFRFVPRQMFGARFLTASTFSSRPIVLCTSMMTSN